MFLPLSLWHLALGRTAELMGSYRKCQRPIPRQKAGMQVGLKLRGQPQQEEPGALFVLLAVGIDREPNERCSRALFQVMRC